MADNLDKRITLERLSDVIIQLFPTEVKRIYFSTSLKKSNHGQCHKLGRGKLLRKFCNRRWPLKDRCLLPRGDKNSKLEIHKDIASIPKCEEVLWLQNATEPWTEVERLWEKTFDNKMLFRNNNFSIMEYMQMFPALKCNLGFSLMETDFKFLHFGYDLNLFNNFNDFSKDLIEYCKTLKSHDVKQYLIYLKNIW